jgi:hypothetical protein
MDRQEKIQKIFESYKIYNKLHKTPDCEFFFAPLIKIEKTYREKDVFYEAYLTDSHVYMLMSDLIIDKILRDGIEIISLKRRLEKRLNLIDHKKTTLNKANLKEKEAIEKSIKEVKTEINQILVKIKNHENNFQ